MNWIRRSGLSAKCAFTAQSAGAIAAPAITVKRLIERIVNVNRPEICLVCIKSLFLIEYHLVEYGLCQARILQTLFQTLTNPRCKNSKKIKIPVTSVAEGQCRFRQ